MTTGFVRAFDRLREYAEHFLSQATPATPLLSIFSQLYDSKDGLPPPTQSFFHERQFALDQPTLFPTDQATAISQADPTLRNTFKLLYRMLPSEGESRLEQLYYLLQHYTWGVVSRRYNGISLFDEARIEAALSAADADRTGVYIIGGDISGIQDFIYTVSAAGATKALRARSLYLQLLTDAVGHYLLQQAQMPITNLLYSGGGRFYVILPASAAAQLQTWRQELAHLMLRRHNAELYVGLGGLHFDHTALDQHEIFEQQWKTLNEEISADKRRRFALLPATTLHQEVFQPFGPGGQTDSYCLVCGYQGTQNELQKFEPNNPDDNRHICLLCDSFEDLAIKIRKATFLRLTFKPAQIPSQRKRVPALDILADLGVKVEPLTSLDNPASTTDHQRIWAIQTPLAVAKQQELIQKGIVWGNRPIVNVFPLVARPLEQAGQIATQREKQVRAWLNSKPEETTNTTPGAIKSFGWLTHQSKGIHRLGILRMDVDDLGSLFANSMQRLRLFGIGSLSAALARFFEGWVGEVCRSLNADPEIDNGIYGVYSGGDDLFIVGTWDVLPELARRITSGLKEYAINPRVHLSAGLSLHGQKFPLYKGAEAAHAALDQAKNRPHRTKGVPSSAKNAWCFLDQTVGWEDGAEQVFELKTQLVDWIRTHEQLSRAVLQVLQEMYSQYLVNLKSGEHRKGESTKQLSDQQLFYGPWIWHGVYQLARMKDEAKRRHNPEAAAFLQTISDKLNTNLITDADKPSHTGTRFIEQVGLAARWAQLELRSNSDD